MVISDNPCSNRAFFVSRVSISLQLVLMLQQPLDKCVNNDAERKYPIHNDDHQLCDLIIRVFRTLIPRNGTYPYRIGPMIKLSSDSSNVHTAEMDMLHIFCFVNFIFFLKIYITRAPTSRKMATIMETRLYFIWLIISFYLLLFVDASLNYE